MISLLVGKPIVSQGKLVVLCGGVGYGVEVTDSTLAYMNGKDEVTLYIHTHVREDDLRLFGFLTAEMQGLFNLLLTVSGVGPKTALLITNSDLSTLIYAVQHGEVSFFTSFSRVGKKLAQKIIIELKPKLGSLEDLELGDLPQEQNEVREALLSLGYGEHEIRTVLRLTNDTNKSVQEQIKRAIRELSRR